MGYPDMECKVRLFITVISCIIVAMVSSVSTVQPSTLNPSILTQSSNIGDCHACKIFIDSFNKGLERTSRGKFEGGDAAWEEEKLKKSYKRSEIRLVDILEGICSEQKKHSVHCYNIAEKAEELIEAWWAQDPEEAEDLFTFICINNLQVCCPKLHYGKDCTPCPGDHNNICSGNGKCRGDGTRKGNGTCLCDTGYVGINCEDCALGYYLSYKDDTKMLCSACHPSCLGGCRGASQKDCVACNPGFTFDVDEGCLDINECDDVSKCKHNEFCLNSLGSYKCMECDKSCDGCHSDGPDMCRKCAKGYTKKGELCLSNREEEDLQSEQLTNTRKDEL
ncbi:protein disulfide isomerase Creld1-like isoform X2 [Epargyreus clarus]|uniref:protein disulfide isomerase Creld1-like isoform X2 n=1 Tax=Epargyreus clarus TaxID=520877 RepID=UPI003C2BFE04